MYEKIYSKLGILNLTELVKQLQKIDEIIPVDKIVEDNKLLIDCDGYEPEAVSYFACRYLYETERNIRKSIYKMVNIFEKLFDKLDHYKLELLIIDIAYDIEYQINFGKNKFRHDLFARIKAKINLLEVISKERGRDVKVKAITYSGAYNSLMAITNGVIITIKFKNNKIQKYLDIIDAIHKEDTTYVIDCKEHNKEWVLSDEDNKVEYKELPEEVKNKMITLGIIDNAV